MTLRGSLIALVVIAVLYAVAKPVVIYGLAFLFFAWLAVEALIFSARSVEPRQRRKGKR